MWKVCVVVLFVACGGDKADDKKSASSDPKSEADDAASRAVAKLGERRAELAELEAELPKVEALIAKASAALDEAATNTDRVAANARLKVHEEKKSELERRRDKAQDEIDRLTGKSGTSVAIAKVQEFSLKMCACKNKACADRTNTAYTTWGTEMARNTKPEDARNVTAQDTKRMMDAATRYSECYTKLAMESVGEGRSEIGQDDLDNRASAAIAKVGEFSTKMCACTTKACADGVNGEYTQWGREMARKVRPEDARNVTAADTKRMTTAATRYSECYTKLAMEAVGAP